MTLCNPSSRLAGRRLIFIRGVGGPGSLSSDATEALKAKAMYTLGEEVGVHPDE
jgi:hypothetical protein